MLGDKSGGWIPTPEPIGIGQRISTVELVFKHFFSAGIRAGLHLRRQESIAWARLCL